MHILSALFFAISSSGDSFIVGLSYGIKKVRISPLNNFLVAAISGIGTILSMLLGKFLFSFIPNYYGNLIGSSILIILGIYMLINALKNNPNLTRSDTDSTKHHNSYEVILRNPDLLDTNHSKNIEINEALSLGFILCINNIGLGIGASIAGLNPLLTSVLTVIASIIFVPLGCFMGEKLIWGKLSRYSDLLAAMLIISLGVYEMFL
jgi:putative sporulation protein YtaF